MNSLYCLRQVKFIYPFIHHLAPLCTRSCTINPRLPSVGNVTDYFEFSESLSKELKNDLIKSMSLYPQFISNEEESEILNEIEPHMSRLHYESSHWDNAIESYRETERKSWRKSNNLVLDRVRALAFPPSVQQLSYIHILDLSKNGVIKPHVDSVRYCGDTIAGLSLLSDSVMRLRNSKSPSLYCDIFLPRLSLYIMNGAARYDFTHEVLSESESFFRGKEVRRERRISLVCRNAPILNTEDEPMIFEVKKL